MSELEIDVQVTNRCNLNCNHCIYSSNNEGKHMPIDMMKEVVYSAINLNCKKIHITGGEPLVHPKLFEIIKEAHENEIEIRLQSNGLLLKNNFPKLIEHQISDVLISIDGLRDYHDSFRHHLGLYETCLSAIDKLKNNGITVRVNTAICKDNVNQVMKLSYILEKHNVDFHSYFYLTPLGRGKIIKDRCLSPSEWYKFQEGVKKGKFDGTMKIKIQKAFVSLNEYTYSSCRLLKRNNIHISVDGTVYPCVFLNGTKMSLGNLNEKLEDIWLDEEKWKRIRDAMNSKKCPYNKNCVHGCLGFSYQFKNSFKNCDPRCQGGNIVPNCIRTYEIL